MERELIAEITIRRLTPIQPVRALVVCAQNFTLFVK